MTKCFELTEVSIFDILIMTKLRLKVSQHLSILLTIGWEKFSLHNKFQFIKENNDPDKSEVCEDGYESFVMRECGLATVRRSVFNLCFLYVSSDIQGL